MADEKDIAKIVAGVIGVGAVGVGIAALINAVIDDEEEYVPDYSTNDRNTENDESSNVPVEDVLFEEDRIQREMDSMWNNHQMDQMWENYGNSEMGKTFANDDFDSAQQEFEQKSNARQLEYLYLDFTQNLKSGSRNWNDVYQESLEA